MHSDPKLYQAYQYPFAYSPMVSEAITWRGA